MPRERTGWAILGGCAFLLALVCVLTIGGYLLVAPELLRKATGWMAEQQADMIAEEQAWAAIERAWQSLPEDAGPEQLFPGRVADYQRTTMDRATAQDLDIPMPGEHAIYAGENGTIEMFVYQVTELERAALFRRVARAVFEEEVAGSFEHQTRTSYSISSLRQQELLPRQRGILWWKQGWLFLVRTESEEDVLAFFQAYVREAAGSTSGPGSGSSG